MENYSGQEIYEAYRRIAAFNRAQAVYDEEILLFLWVKAHKNGLKATRCLRSGLEKAHISSWWIDIC